MNFLAIILTVLGLSVFEIITSIDNAIINAEVLSTMGKKARRWFLTFGILFSVFLVRGILPFLILYAATPQLGIMGTLTVAFSNSPEVAETVKNSSHVLLIAGGIFLIFLFFHWLFLEPKNFGIRGERFFQAQGAWFFATVSVLLTVIVWYAFQKEEPLLEFGAVVGSTAFFIIHGFRQYAEDQEKKLLSSGMSDISKIAYLEVLDASFSIDGVVGAFAFTFAIPLILIGNGLGAIILRQLTVSNIERIKKYAYLKNGAMYSILVLGIIMLLDSFGVEIPAWISPVATLLTVGYFFNKSRIELKDIQKTLKV
ncbi:DUF475 domain-containing protein [Candidatus Gottesmanbacteria bacterium]|nr:DUF475 domain-containing protein [Candidatus Gottesmanbacteria bacterium]